MDKDEIFLGVDTEVRVTANIKFDGLNKQQILEWNYEPTTPRLSTQIL